MNGNGMFVIVIRGGGEYDNFPDIIYGPFSSEQEAMEKSKQFEDGTSEVYELNNWEEKITTKKDNKSSDYVKKSSYTT